MLTQTRSITDQLREKLLEGEFLPGTHLQEIPLASELGVSRTPVRAALAALEREGLLDYAPKRGFMVREFSPDEISDKYLVRSVLEGAAAGQCTRLGLDAEMSATIEESLASGDRILARGILDPADLPAYRMMNNRFHATIIAGSQSRTTADYVRQIEQIPFLSDRIILWQDYRLIARSHDDHHRVYDAIQRRDPTRAEALMREHVYFMGLTVRAYLEANGASGLAALTAEEAGKA